MRRVFKAAVVAGAVAVAAGLGVGFATASENIPGTPAAAAQAESLLKQARTACAPEQGSQGALTEGHDGEVTLVINAGVADTEWEDPIAEIDAAYCVLEKIDAPDSVTARMDTTRALDGMQEAQWGNYRASWTYHPDNGLDLIITES